MTFADSTHHGSAILIPCLHAPTTIGSLIEEARALWGAEIKNADTRAIGAPWGTVGIMFRNTATTLRAEWIQFFRQQQLAPVTPVDSDGLLNLPWLSTLDGKPIDVDLILATATRPSTGKLPSAIEVADAWIGGHQRYFFENVRAGICTPEDRAIWQRIKAEQPAWLPDTIKNYQDVVSQFEISGAGLRGPHLPSKGTEPPSIPREHISTEGQLSSPRQNPAPKASREPRTVFVLGAGVSVPAGLPAMRDLFPALMQFWAKHQGCSGLVKIFEDEGMGKVDPHADFEGFLTQFYLSRPFPYQIGDCITEYFNARQQAILKQPDALHYLKVFVHHHVRPSDIILTFNYDWLLERVLHEAGLWNISDGYGFPRNILRGDQPLTEGPSECTVLKLHGSAGWVSGHPGFHKTGEFFLQNEGISFAGYDGCTDEQYGQFKKSPSKRTFQLPTFVKDFSTEPLPTLWRKAATALRNAQRVVIIGYSLPPSDTATWTLLLSTLRECQECTYCWYECGNAQRAEEIREQFARAGLQLNLVPCDITRTPLPL